MPDEIPDSRKRQKHLHGLYIIVCVLAVTVILFAGYRTFRRFFSGFTRDFMSPFLNSVVRTEDKTAATALMLNSKVKLARQLAASSRENARLTAENSMLKTLERENADLRALLKLPRKVNYQPVFAEVVARAVPTWRETFVINRGEDDGISPGDLVVAADESGRLAAAGRIKEVSKRTSSVITLFSEECHFSVILASSRHVGGMEFEPYVRVPKVKYLPADGTYAEGELVATSGISSHTPHGLPIGRVVKSANGNVATIRDQMFAEVEVRPFLKMDAVKYVAVYTKRSVR